jgi:hypothetical protein
MDVLQAIRFIISSWNEVTTETIHNCWKHTNILTFDEFPINNNSDIICEDDNELTNDISKNIQALHLPNAMNIDEFLSVPDEDTVYTVLEDDEIITELVDIFKNSEDDVENIEESDDSVEPIIIDINVALKSLENIQMFLLQQENSEKYIKFANTIEKFIKTKKFNMTRQTSLDDFFFN